MYQFQADSDEKKNFTGNWKTLEAFSAGVKVLVVMREAWLCWGYSGVYTGV